MPPSSSELWSHQLMPSTVLVDCLLPNGILVQLPCSRDATLSQIKSRLWKEAGKYPVFSRLLAADHYIFISITQDAEKEEFYDEGRRLCDLRLFQPILKIVEPEGNKEEKMLNYEIGLAIGVPINELNESDDLEVLSFRKDILSICEQSVKERQGRDRQGIKSLSLYYYPPDVEDDDLPAHLNLKLQGNNHVLIVCVWIMSGVESKQKITVRVQHDAKPENVIIEAIRKKTHSMHLTREHQQMCIEEHQDSYLLKVCGLKQYLLGSYPLFKFSYVRKCIMKSSVPQLLLIKRTDFENDLPKSTFLPPSFLRTAISKLRQDPNRQHFSLWNVSAPVRVKVNSASFVNVKEVGKIFVRAGIYLGTEPLCGSQDTKLVDSSNPLWNEWMDFDIQLPDVPRCARLCLSLCCCVARRRRMVYTLAWGNVNVFDFRNQLMSGKVSWNLWPVPQGMDDLLNPIGSPSPNPGKDAPCLQLEFPDYGAPVLYPSKPEFLEYAQKLNFAETNRHYEELPLLGHDVDGEMKLLSDIIQRDVLADISEQEKELLWRRREDCLNIPDSLPKLLKAVKWNKRDDVAQLYWLLKKWPCLSVSAAMELLDCTYLDLTIREFSVTCLHKTLSDDKLSQYLLQLVQGLKVEPYLNNALTRFLLRRALVNKNIGHFLFWHLKSEVYHVSIKLRFSLILEAYCRGCGAYLKDINRQVESLEKLTKITDSIKGERDEDKYRIFCEQANRGDCSDALQNLTSPLDCTIILGQLLLDQSRVKHSKKSPLSLCWLNPDPSASCQSNDLIQHKIIFKNGDDLRQDMLTLQVISIMERIWQSEGLDLKMTPYGCLATGKSVGMIEEVRNCKTVMQIQKAMGTMAAMQVDNSKLYKWIKEHNRGDAFEEALETFVRSCAGYCVATFVLGIGDRHPDNIMVTTDGHVFHIDFGHFLDHRKKKFGIQRERVPFILTDDFICVIGANAKNPTRSKGFFRFMELCGQAYMTLRKHANIFITLFSMMLGCGIPELQSTDDIEYLRKTLAVESSDEAALKYFQTQFHDAYGGAWTTRIDWFFHYLMTKA